MKKLFFLLSLQSIIFFAVFAQTKMYWSPEQIMKLKNVTAVRVAPNGSKVIYSVREAVMTDDKSEYVNQIFVSDLSGKNTLQLTKGDGNNANPKWSPDSKMIAFTSNRTGKNNLYVLPVEGGESEKLTDVKSGVAEFKWGPDGKTIAYVMADSPSDAEEKNKKGKNDWYFMDEEVKQGRLYVLWINEKDTVGKQKVLQLTKDNRHITAFDWSPDGKYIVYSHALSPKVNDDAYSDISMVNLASGEVKNVANSMAGESNPIFSPDGKSIAYIASDDEVVWGGKSFIRIVPAAGGSARQLTGTPNEPNNLLGWSGDSKYLYANEPSHTSAKIFQIGVEGKTVKEWSVGTDDFVSIIDLNSSGTHFGMVIQNPAKPGDAFVSTTFSFVPVKISAVNPGIGDFPVPKTEVVKWKSFDGKEIEGLLTYPVGFEKGKKYPLILNIHGGPAGVFSETFIGNIGTYPIAAFAEKGFLVLRPNPRGSTGYGVDFRLANQRDWGGADYKDLMTGVDYVVNAGMADTQRLGVMGWSYGGFMSSWIVGQTNRFKAASIGAPVVDLAAQNMTDDVTGLLTSYMKKQPWEDWDIYSRHSPLRYVQNVKTPVLLQQGEADIRVPFSQGVMFYNALKRRSVPVRFLVLPRQPHGPTEPKMILKVMQTNLEWMGKYLMKDGKSL